MSTRTTPQSFVRHWVNWRSAVLAGTCVAGGLALNMMVLAITPDGPSESLQSAEPVEVASSVATVESVVPVEVVVTADTVASAPVVDVADVVAVAEETAAVQAGPATPIDTVALAPLDAGSAAPPAAAPAAQLPPVPAAPVSRPSAATTPTTPDTTTKPTAPTTAAPTPAAPATAAPTTAAPATAVPTTMVPTTVGGVTISYPSYSTKAGEIYLQLVDNKEISVYSVVRGDGWVYEIDKNGPRSVEVKFFNTVTEREAEFHAEIENGRIKVES